MSQTMNQKTAAKKKHKKSRLPVVEEPEQLSGAEKLLEDVRPHLTTIGLVIVAITLGFIAVAFMISSRFEQNAAQWRELATSSAIAMRSGNLNGLKEVADTYPDTKAGLWALQIAGDQELRTGIEQLSYDREAGLQLIEKAKKSYLRIVEAPEAIKTTMLNRRSYFSLAYANESLGKFDEANALYKEILESDSESAFAEPARRGVERTSNEQYNALYTLFANYEVEVIGDAPGPAIPERPVIEFPDALPAGEKPPATEGASTGGGGQFEPASTTTPTTPPTEGDDSVPPTTESDKSGKTDSDAASEKANEPPSEPETDDDK